MEYHFAARGFWLPCDQAHFFHHEGHKWLRRTIELSELDRTGDENKLDDQVYHRLAVVLGNPRFGFTHAIPVYHSERPFGQDPDAGLFVHAQFEDEPFTVPDEGDHSHEVTLPSNVHVHGLALLVNSSGFYLLLARYTASEHPHKSFEAVQEYLRWYIYRLVGGNFASRYSGWPDDKYLVTDQYELDHTLKQYAEQQEGILTFDQINTIFEGLFSAALDFEVFFYDSESEKRERLLEVKRSYSLGRFMDLIASEVHAGEYRYVTPGDNLYDAARRPVDELHEEDIAEFLHSLNALHPQPSHGIAPQARSMGEEAHYLCHDFLGVRGCGVLLRKFLQATAASTLQEYKRRVERCRRALVTEILEVTQRQDPLVQAEVPDERHNRIQGVNEAQLRGYVLLFSAKLPLINNVRLYLREITEMNAWFRPRRGATDTRDSEGEKGTSGQDREEIEAHKERARAGGQGMPKLSSEAEREVAAALALWRTLYAALESDVQGLERAIEQERMDTMVREETKLRAEQETLAEIQRLQDRNTKSLSPRQTLTISALANVFALFSVVLALYEVLNYSGISTSPPHGTPSAGTSLWQVLLSNLSWASFLIFIGSVAGLALFYWLMHQLATVLLAGVSHVLRLARIRWSERFYYEMDVHMEVPLDIARAGDLLKGIFPPIEADAMSAGTDTGTEALVRQEGWLAQGTRFWTEWGRFWRQVWCALYPSVWLAWWRLQRGRSFTRVERNSYRVERMTANEAEHKIYVEGALRLPRKQDMWRRRPRIPLILVYELLFHRPTEAHRFILQDLRVISTTSLVLTGEQLAYIKEQIADRFVNPFISQKQGTRRIEWKSRTNAPVDALMSLTAESVPAQTQAQSGGHRLWLSLLKSVSLVLRLGGLGAAVYVIRAVIVAGQQLSQHGLHILLNGNTLVMVLALNELRQFLVDWWWVTLVPAGLAALLTGMSLVIGAIVSRRSQSTSDQPGDEPDGPGPRAGASERMGTRQRVVGLLGFAVLGVLQGVRVLVLLGLATLGIVVSLPMLGDLFRLIVTAIW